MKRKTRVLTRTERMELELSDVLSKLEKIKAFTKTETWVRIDAIEKELLGAQYSAMQSYARILDIRLKIAYGRTEKEGGAACGSK